MLYNKIIHEEIIQFISGEYKQMIHKVVLDFTLTVISITANLIFSIMICLICMQPSNTC